MGCLRPPSRGLRCTQEKRERGTLDENGMRKKSKGEGEGEGGGRREREGGREGGREEGTQQADRAVLCRTEKKSLSFSVEGIRTF
jgi:hypothetical protein